MPALKPIQTNSTRPLALKERSLASYLSWSTRTVNAPSSNLIRLIWYWVWNGHAIST